MKKIFIQISLLIFSSGLLFVSADAQRAGEKRPAETAAVKAAEPVVITDGAGIYGLSVGKSSRADVIKKLGDGYELIKHYEYSYEMIYHDSGLSFYTCQSDGGNELFVIRIQAPFKAKTETGIVLGESTFADVVRIYGKPKEKYNNNYSYKGIEFYYDEEYADSTDDKVEIKQKKVIAINIIESNGLRQCGSKKEIYTNEGR
ncbi:MAG TPA: hypothetical protein VGC76_11900 [Pyrinomonadaceae bacterium]|jgi:hypothetical protein